MGAIDRRDFLVRSGLAISAAILAAEIPLPKVFADSPSLKLDSWKTVREQFQLSNDFVHLAGFFLASHPAPVRAAIERHRRGLDADPIGYWSEHEEKQEAAVLRAAAEYLAVDPTEIALTDSTTMGLGPPLWWPHPWRGSGDPHNFARSLCNRNVLASSCRTHRGDRTPNPSL